MKSWSWADGQLWVLGRWPTAAGRVRHSEGDVWTHTKSVYAQLPDARRVAGFSRLPERTVLVLTAPFHDSAKPMTSQVDPIKGRINGRSSTLFGGEHLARSVLRDLWGAISRRGKRSPGWSGSMADRRSSWSRAEPNYELISTVLARQQQALLYLFALADTRRAHRRPRWAASWRRTCISGGPVAEECGCLDRSYPFATDLAYFLFYRQARPNPHYAPFEAHRWTQ